MTNLQSVGIINPLKADRKANTWHKVTFDQPFSEDSQIIVIPMTQTYVGNETPGLRLRNVNAQGFEIRFDEVISGGKNSDGDHGDEQVGWIAYGLSKKASAQDIQNVMSKTQISGIINPLTADRKANTWHKVTFEQTFSQDSQIIVIPMTQTYLGAETPGLRIRNVNAQGFEIRFDEIISSAGTADGDHVHESVGWIACDLSKKASAQDIQNVMSKTQISGIINPLTADRQTNKWHKVTFEQTFSQDSPVVVIPMTQTYLGAETPGLRIRNVNAQGFEIRFDEIISSAGTADGGHAHETVGWIAYSLAESKKEEPKTPEAKPESQVDEDAELTITATKDVILSKLVHKGQVKRTQADEYVEVTNPSNSPANISGWKITSAGGRKQVFTFPEGTILESGKSFRVYTNQVHPETGGFSFGSKTAIWNDQGDEAKLFDAEGNNVSTIAYGN